MEDKRYLRKLQTVIGMAVRKGEEVVLVAGKGDKMYACIIDKKENLSDSLNTSDYDWYEVIELKDKKILKRTKYVMQPDGQWKTINGVINGKEAK